MSRKPILAASAMAALLATVAVPVFAQDADTSDKRVGFSNNYAANSWRQAMLKSWDELSQQVVPDVVAAADVRTTATNDATLQQQQIGDMILEGYNAIVINAANPESLNSVVEEACGQGIPVVSFDGIVTAERPRRHPLKSASPAHGCSHGCSHDCSHGSGMRRIIGGQIGVCYKAFCAFLGATRSLSHVFYL